MAWAGAAESESGDVARCLHVIPPDACTFWTVLLDGLSSAPFSYSTNEPFLAVLGPVTPPTAETPPFTLTAPRAVHDSTASGRGAKTLIPCVGSGDVLRRPSIARLAVLAR